MNAALAERAPVRQRHIDFQSDQVRTSLNRRSFAVRHNLSEHPLFALPRLIELARATADHRPECLHFEAGRKDVGQGFDQTPTIHWPVDETIRRMENAGAWIVVRHADREPEYAHLLEECIEELLENAEPDLRRNIAGREVTVFITSPGFLTPYHIDRECNFLLQLRGEKTIHIFDGTDAEVVTQPEVERLWTGDYSAGIYKPQFQERAWPFRLKPGNGVHIPVHHPHWLQNDDNVSVSLSVNFLFRDSLAGNLYRANHFLRRAGITPLPPGRSRVRDSLKRGVVTAGMAAVNATPEALKKALKTNLR
jgi:hypothetical protein